jgi:hypothetical protein
MPDPFVVGAICYIDKDTDSAKDGTTGVVTQVDHANEGNLAGILFYRDAEDAKKISSHVVVAGNVAGNMPAEIMALVAGADTSLTDCTRRKATTLTTAGQWHGFFTAYVPAGNSLVGTTFQVADLPVFENGAIVGTFSGPITVVSATGNNLDVTFTQFGNGRQMTYSDSFIRSVMVQRALLVPVATAPSPARIDRTMCGAFAFDVVKALPASKALPNDTLCGNEAMAVCTAAMLNGLHATDPIHANFTLALTINLSMLNALLTSGGGPPTGHVWPNMDAARLGQAIKRACTPAAGAPPVQTDRFPHVTALRSKCVSPAQFAAFLRDAVPTIIENDRQTALALANEHVRVGALEKYLTDRGQLGSVASINDLEDNLDSPTMLEIIMFRMGEKNTTYGKHGGGASSLKVQFTNPDITGSSEERARRLTIRGDAEIVFENDNLRTQLNSLHDFAGDPAALYSAVKSTGNIHLKRAITSNEDIDKALSGEHTTSNHHMPAQPAQPEINTNSFEFWFLVWLF